MKFTEEQFKKLVEIQEDQYCDDLYFEPKSSNKAVEHVVEQHDPELNDFIDNNSLGNEAVALMNPVTRELAYEKYVEKEKRYVWTSKKRTNSGDANRLFESIYGGINVVSIRGGRKEVIQREKLTESEIREWGYDPERFDKEEVE